MGLCRASARGPLAAFTAWGMAAWRETPRGRVVKKDNRRQHVGGASRQWQATCTQLQRVTTGASSLVPGSAKERLIVLSVVCLQPYTMH
jgi:hypothetical protein